jgi:hypothetical protein
MNPGTREEGEEVMEQLEPTNSGPWPVEVRLWRDRPGVLRLGDLADLPARYETCRYFAESSPNALTPEEARLLIGALDEVDFEHWEPLGELEKRLKAWAEEEEH